MTRTSLSLLAVLSLAALLGCTEKPAAKSPAPEARPVLVLAAASTVDALDEIRKEFTAATGIAVSASYDSSSNLARQIENGAEADLFISADQKWADHVTEKGLTAQRVDLLGNRLVIVVPADSTLEIKQPQDLVNEKVEHLAVGEPSSVPAGRYAKQAFEKLGLWDSLKGKLAPAEDVRRALVFVETGAAEAGIVYATDAARSKKVKVVAEIDEGLTGPVRYPLVLLTKGKSNPSATKLYDYLAGEKAAAAFAKHGFVALATR